MSAASISRPIDYHPSNSQMANSNSGAKKSRITDLPADLYIRNSQLQQDLSAVLLNRCRFAQGSTAIDVGCGDGRVTASLLSRIPQGKVIGIDASSSMIEAAKNHFFSQNNKINSSLEFRQAKAEDLSSDQFADVSSSIEVVTSFSCLHWVKEATFAISKMCEMLATNGDLLILTYPRRSQFYTFMDRALEQDFPAFRMKSSHNTMLDTEGYRTAIQSAGLNITHFQEHNKLASFPDEEAFKRFVKSWLINFVPLPESDHDRFLESVVRESIPHRQDLGDGQIHLPYTALTIMAKKPVDKASDQGSRIISFSHTAASKNNSGIDVEEDKATEMANKACAATSCVKFVLSLLRDSLRANCGSA